MPNLGLVLKSEMSRVAGKELRPQMQQLKSSAVHDRRQIADLKRRVLALERAMGRLVRGSARKAPSIGMPPDATAAGTSAALRFSAKGLAAQRKRLGLSAASMAQLLGVSALSIYKWESGNTRPRSKQLEAIAALRRIGKREAMARLAA